MSYSLIKKFLFQLEPEKAHQLSLAILNGSYQLGLNKLLFPSLPRSPRNLMGLTFPNPVGLAAGLDKNGDYLNSLASLGFGFIEIGTVTPKAQPGNPKPRLFRLVKEEAIINRLGFNNEGLEYLIAKVKAASYPGILGINIGKNRDTPLEKANEDYRLGFQAVAPFASYITINISSPNTAELRNLQHGELLRELLSSLKNEQAAFKLRHNKYVPLVVKIAPDLNDDELNEMAEVLLSEGIDGVIATNTTIHREAIQGSNYCKEVGGLSGKPLMTRSTQILSRLNFLLQGKIPIIAAGGIFSVKDAEEKLAAGASLVQVYTGFIYQGPWWLRKLIKSLGTITAASAYL